MFNFFFNETEYNDYRYAGIKAFPAGFAAARWYTLLVPSFLFGWFVLGPLFGYLLGV